MANTHGRPIGTEIYHYVGDQRLRLYPDPQLFAVRLEHKELSEKAQEQLNEVQPVTFIARDRLNIYRADSNQLFIERLRKEAGVRLAFPAFRYTPESSDVVFITPRLLVQFRPELSPENIAVLLDQFHLQILEPLAYASPNGFLLEAEPGIDGLGALVMANTLKEKSLVVFAEPDLIQQRHWRYVSTPNPTAAQYLDQQWHLRTVGVFEAWKETQGDPAIKIAVLDDGVDVAHPEFNVSVNAAQPKVAAQFDFATGKADASPKTYSDNHGTPCAGIAAAAGIKAAGVAPSCRLIIVRTPDYLGASDEARMFQWVADSGADVITCSWGPSDGTGINHQLPTATRLAIRYCLTNGRVGKGISIFWAAGNGGESVSSDGYATNPDVMAIAACAADDTSAPYSDYGSEIFACAPSNGGAGQPAIFTSDRHGVAGYNSGRTISGDAIGDYTNNFGGTSAATPLAAGIAALMLSVNPALTAAQVRDLLRSTAERIGDATSYDINGHSIHFGYGRLNAAKAVAAARLTSGGLPTHPSILGPAIWSRVDNPPIFQVDPRPGIYYVVEVATDPILFDANNQAGQRTAYNFYGSWSDSPFQTAATYRLPMTAWTLLRLADRIWYRVGATTSATGYVNYIVSTPDNQGNLAGLIQVVPGIGSPPPTTGASRRKFSDLIQPTTRSQLTSQIEGPIHWNRQSGPPTFRIESGYAANFTVEIATRRDQFDCSAKADDVSSEPYFVAHLQGRKGDDYSADFQAYILPLETWELLSQAQELYYRLVIQDGKTSASPIFVMHLMDGDKKLYKDAKESTRVDETLWRLPEGVGHEHV